jgi:hypothetical protein
MRSKSNRDQVSRGRNAKETSNDGRARSKTPLRNLFRREKPSPLGSSFSDSKNHVVDSSPTSAAVDLGLTHRRKAITCDYDLNPTLLYKLIEYRAWDEVIERTLQTPLEAATWVVRHSLSDPEAAEDPSNRWLCWKMLPLHTAILFRAPITAVQAIYNAFPEAISMPDDRNMFPIHVACRIRVESAVMQFLIDAFPSALTMTDYKGRSPSDLLRLDQHKTGEEYSLIKLIENNIALHGINEGIEANSFGAIHPDLEVDYDKNPTALIRLIESKSWIEAIARCQRFPQEAASWLCRYENGGKKGPKDLRWRILPIHSAVVLNAPKPVIKALVDAYSDGLRMGDDRDMLPIHMAFRLGIDLAVCALLIESYPQSLQHRDNKGNTPMQILKAYRKKYLTAELRGVRIDNPIDLRRKILIDYYLEGRYYRGDSIKNETGMGSYDSDYDSYTAATDSDNDDGSYSSYYSADDENKLFYEGMLKDLVHLTLKGLVNAPKIMCACNSIPL